MPGWNATMLESARVCRARMPFFNRATQAKGAENIATQPRSVAIHLDEFASAENLGAEIPVATPTASYAVLQSAINAAVDSSMRIVGPCSVGHKPFWKCRPNSDGSIIM